jgi:hypothetical protein
MYFSHPTSSCEKELEEEKISETIVQMLFEILLSNLFYICQKILPSVDAIKSYLCDVICEFAFSVN